MNISFRFIFPFILPFLTAASMTAPKTNFDAYNAQYDQGTCSTVKRLKQTPPDSGYPFVLITSVKFKGCDKGIPTEQEQSNLDRVSDSVYANVTRVVKNIMAGTFTYQCERKEYYYVADTTQIRDRLSALYKKYFSAYDANISIKLDKDWDTYRKLLHPNE